MSTDATAATTTADDEDRLPWLEPIEDEETGPSPAKLIAAVLIGLVAIGVIVGGLFWLGSRAAGGGGTDGQGEVIASPGDYKVPAPDPGGMKVDDKGSTQVATSEGTEQTSSVNPNARPETPVNQPAQNNAAPAPRPATPPAATPAPAQPQRPAPAPAQQARLSGPTIQVGAYPSEAAANGEWARLSQRYPYLRGLNHAVVRFQRGNQTFYRLRAAGGEAPNVCRRLRAAGQPCMDVND